MKQFLTALQAGLVLFAMALSGTGWASEMPGRSLAVDLPTLTPEKAPDMTGAYYARDTLIPRADDLALLQRPPALYLASFNGGMATVAYSLQRGRIVYRMVDGEVTEAGRSRIDRALVKLQRKLA